MTSSCFSRCRQSSRWVRVQVRSRSGTRSCAVDMRGAAANMAACIWLSLAEPARSNGRYRSSLSAGSMQPLAQVLFGSEAEPGPFRCSVVLWEYRGAGFWVLGSVRTWGVWGFHWTPVCCCSCRRTRSVRLGSVRFCCLQVHWWVRGVQPAAGPEPTCPPDQTRTRIKMRHRVFVVLFNRTRTGRFCCPSSAPEHLFFIYIR